MKENIKKEKLYYPGVDYDAKKDYPVVEEDVLEYRKKHDWRKKYFYILCVKRPGEISGLLI